MAEPDNIAELVADWRLVIADTDPAHKVYTDAEGVQFLRMEGWSVNLAAAKALETHATHIAMVAGAVRGLLDIRIGGEQSAKALLDVAARLRGTDGSAAYWAGTIDIFTRG